MTWLAIKAFLSGALGRLWEALGALWDAICKHPWPAAVIALSAVLAVTVGHDRHVSHQRDAAVAKLAARIKVEDAAAKAQKAENARIQSAYQGASNDAQKRYDASLADARDATAGYIARNRVRPAICPSGSGNPTTQASDSTVPETAAASAVVVDQSDVERCGADYSYAKAAYDWAADLVAKGLAQ